ncbi:hypothetical protein CIW49_17355 [Mycolicibacterium sp. P1-18]|nr:hypothetical protein CIW49_17355 [Mycolicibacterium sp. P1-18]
MALLAAGGQVASADPPVPGLDRDVTLGGGQEASVDGLRVRFADVLEDSRCPASVACFWTGQARLAVVGQTEDAAPTTVEFNTNPAPRQGVWSGQVGEYTITMHSLEPYPQTPDDPTPLEDYRLTLSVTKG